MLAIVRLLHLRWVSDCSRRVASYLWILLHFASVAFFAFLLSSNANLPRNVLCFACKWCLLSSMALVKYVWWRLHFECVKMFMRLTSRGRCRSNAVLIKIMLSYYHLNIMLKTLTFDLFDSHSFAERLWVYKLCVFLSYWVEGLCAV